MAKNQGLFKRIHRIKEKTSATLSFPDIMIKFSFHQNIRYTLVQARTFRQRRTSLQTDKKNFQDSKSIWNYNKIRYLFFFQILIGAIYAFPPTVITCFQFAYPPPSAPINKRLTYGGLIFPGTEMLIISTTDRSFKKINKHITYENLYHSFFSILIFAGFC